MSNKNMNNLSEQEMKDYFKTNFSLNKRDNIKDVSDINNSYINRNIESLGSAYRLTDEEKKSLEDIPGISTEGINPHTYWYYSQKNGKMRQFTPELSRRDKRKIESVMYDEDEPFIQMDTGGRRRVKKHKKTKKQRKTKKTNKQRKSRKTRKYKK